MRSCRQSRSTAKCFTYLLLPAVVATGCQSWERKPADLETVRKAIDAGNAEWIEAFRSGDADRLAHIFDKSGCMLCSGGRIARGPDDIRSVINPTMEAFGPTEMTIETEDIWVSGDIAYETGRYSYAFTPANGEPTTLSGRYVVRWKRQRDDTWKIDMDLGLPDD
jgi:uncharacterized protein (TIGR02246 family)